MLAPANHTTASQELLSSGGLDHAVQSVMPATAIKLAASSTTTASVLQKQLEAGDKASRQYMRSQSKPVQRSLLVMRITTSVRLLSKAVPAPLAGLPAAPAVLPSDPVKAVAQQQQCETLAKDIINLYALDR